MYHHHRFVGWTKTTKENCSLQSSERSVNSLDECLEFCGAHGWCRAALYEKSVCYVGDILDQCMVETEPYSQSQDTTTTTTTSSTTTTFTSSTTTTSTSSTTAESTSTTTTSTTSTYGSDKKRKRRSTDGSQKTVFYKSYSCERF